MNGNPGLIILNNVAINGPSSMIVWPINSWSSYICKALICWYISIAVGVLICLKWVHLNDSYHPSSVSTLLKKGSSNEFVISTTIKPTRDLQIVIDSKNQTHQSQLLLGKYLCYPPATTSHYQPRFATMIIKHYHPLSNVIACCCKLNIIIKRYQPLSTIIINSYHQPLLATMIDQTILLSSINHHWSWSTMVNCGVSTQ